MRLDSATAKDIPKAADFSFSSLPFLIGFLFGIHAVNPEIPGFPKMAKWEIKNPVTEMKNPSDESSSRLDMTEERSSELDDMSIETSQIENSKREKKTKLEEKREQNHRNCETTIKCVTYIEWKYRKKEKGAE